MTSLARHSGPWATFALSTVVLALGACGRVPGQFEILNDQVPQPGCLIGVDTTVYRGRGTMDLSLVRAGSRGGYVVWPLMKNNMPAPTSGGIDNNQIFISSFAVDISPLNAPTQTGILLAGIEAGTDTTNPRSLLHFKQPWSGTIGSGGGLLSASVPAFPVNLARAISATNEIDVSPGSLTMNLRITAFGNTPYQDIQSDPFDFPIAVCAGCLVGNVQACPYQTAPANPGNECNVSQDAVVDCCTQNGTLICPPLVVAQ
jgi:hypothetical protein